MSSVLNSFKSIMCFSQSVMCCSDARAPGCDIPSESSSSKHPVRKYTSSNLVPASGPQARLPLHQHQMVASRDNMCWPMPVRRTVGVTLLEAVRQGTTVWSLHVYVAYSGAVSADA